MRFLGSEIYGSWQSSLEEPHKLVEIVPGDLLRLGEYKDGFMVPGIERLLRTTILAYVKKN